MTTETHVPDTQPPAPTPDAPTSSSPDATWPPTATSAAGPPPPAEPPAAESGAGRPPRLGWRQYLAVAAVSATAAAAIAVPVSMDDDPVRTTTPAVATAENEAPRSIDAPAEGAMSIAEIANQVTPSVVRIDARAPGRSGSGSGVVYRADGYIVTNNHVVANAVEVSVTLPNGREYPAEVVGTDPLSDVAVLKIDATDLPVPEFAEGAPDIGELTVAIGSPFGLDGSVTSGIVSALNRTVRTRQGAPLVDLIQTDAAINPGNSGGALVNAQAEVIGINTAIATAAGGSNGIGFAIPVDTVRNVADQLIETGEVAHAYLGVRGGTVDPQVADLYGLATDTGAVVASVQSDSPAEAAGLEPGDIIVAVGDQAIESFPQLAGVIQRQPVGEPVTLTVVRDGEEIQLEVTLAERPTG